MEDVLLRTMQQPSCNTANNYDNSFEFFSRNFRRIELENDMLIYGERNQVLDIAKVR